MWYIVKSGDSLFSIAKRFNVPAEGIAKLNNLSGAALNVGQRLRIPLYTEVVINAETAVIRSGPGENYAVIARMVKTTRLPVPSFRTAIALAPNYGLPHYELGKVLVRSKQWSAAAQELQQAVNHDPNLSAAYYQLARVYAKLGETEKSERMLADFEKLYQQQTNDSQTQDDDARKETESPDSP